MKIRKDTTSRQSEISLAARKIIVKYGSEHVTIHRIAQGIGITDGAIYRHFKSKRDILALMVEDIEDDLITDITKNCKGEINSVGVFEKIIADHISSIEQRKGVTFQVIAEIISLGDKKLNKRVYELLNKYTAKISEILSEGIKSGIIRSDIDVEAAAKMFFGMTQGLVNAWALSQYSFKLEERYKPLLNIFLKAIIK